MSTTLKIYYFANGKTKKSAKENLSAVRMAVEMILKDKTN